MGLDEGDGLIFARAGGDDAEAMRALARDAYEIYVDRIGREPAPMVADYQAVAEAGGALLVWRGRSLVGMLETKLEEDAIFIENVAVSPDEQGMGLGSRLLAEAEKLALDAGRAVLRLYTNEAMTENLDFYRHRGFSETRRATQDGYRRVFFTKSVSASKPQPLSRQ
jgi:ribosomal protein S18 acetylase RimI-like enzyme